MSRKTLLIFACVLFAVCTIGMFSVDVFIRNDVTPNGIVSVGFISSVENFNAAMAAWGDTGKIATGFSLGLDYLYIVLYSVVLYLLLILTSEKIMRVSNRGGQLLFIMAILSPIVGASDSIENFSLLQLLLGSQNDLWPKMAYYCAISKFTGAAICTVAMVAGQVYVFAGGRKA